MSVGSSTRRKQEQPDSREGRPKHVEAEPGGVGVSPRVPLVAVIVLAVIGIGVMAQLTHTHWGVSSDPDFASFCPAMGAAGVDCDDVARSEYSELFGIPISFWGLLVYLGIIGVAAWTLRSFRAKAGYPGAGLGLLSVAAVGSIITSAALGYISHVLIEAYCSWCTVGYVLNLCISAAVFTGLWKLRLNPAEALKRDLGFFLQRPAMSASFCGGGLAIAVATLLLYPTPSPVEDASEDAGAEVVVGDEMPNPVWEEAPFKGPADAPVTIVEFTDYECPICKRSHAHLSSILEPYEGQYRIMHRHFPLDQACNPAIPRPYNQHSCRASRFTFCAGEQDKFWELNRLVFGSRQPLEEEHLRRLAERVGCDMDALDECLAGDRPDEHLRRDIQDGIDLEIRGTPTFFINGQRVVGLPQPAVLKKFFEEE